MKNKYYMCGKSCFSEKDKEKLRNQGYDYFYELRSWDDGDGYNIEPEVYVNNIGCIATNFEIKFKNENDKYITAGEFFATYLPKIGNAKLKD